jgi:hypothetical protein
MRKAFPGNNYCPCRSGRKYKQCCALKGIDYFVKPGGKIVREQPLSTEQRAELERLKEEFHQKWGRRPTAEEEGVLRLAGFADASAVIEAELIKSGARPEVIYAFKKTGLVISPENETGISPAERERWQAAVEEFRRSQAAEYK